MKRYYYIIIAICSTLFVITSFGLTLNTFNSYFPYIIEEFNLSNTVNAMLVTIRFSGAILSVFFVDRFYRLVGVRKGMVLITLLVAMAHFICANAKSPVALYVGIFLMGAFYGLGGMFPATILIRRWFRDRQALALGIAACGTGLATIIGGPVVIFSVETFGLLPTFRYESMILVVCAVFLGIFVVPSPDKMGTQPFISRSLKQKEIQKTMSKAAAQPLSRGMQIEMMIAVFLSGIIGLTSTAHLNVHLTYVGYTPGVIATLVSIYGITLTAAKCIYGYLNDRFGSISMNRVAHAVLGVGMLAMSLADFGWWFAPIGMITMAMGMPIETVGLSVWSSELTTEEHYSKLLKNFQFAFILGGLLPATIPGMIADATDSYALAYVLYFFCNAVSFILVQTVYRRVRGKKRQEPSA